MLPAQGEKMQLEIYKHKSGEDRLQSTLELNALIRKITEDGIRSQFPHISKRSYQEQIRIRIAP